VIFISKYKEFVKENYFLIFFEKWQIKNLCQSEQAFIKVFLKLKSQIWGIFPKKNSKTGQIYNRKNNFF
jgi:hypothetical protein